MTLATAATETGLSIADLALYATIFGALGSLVLGGMSALMRYIKERISGETKAQRDFRQVQSEKCQFDHSTIQSILSQQNANIVELLKQNASQIAAYRETTHASELRHQIVLQRLDRLWDHLPKRHSDEVHPL
jgi:hypothetical protein